MQIQWRNAFVLAGFGALASLTTLHTSAAPVRTENSLLGVRLLATYKEVISRFGQPAEIQVGMPVEGESAGGGGAPGMGGPGMPGSGGAPGGMPMAGMPGGGGVPGGGPALPGYGGPGMPGSGGAPGGMPMAGMPGGGGRPAGGGMGGAANSTDANALPIIPGSGSAASGPSEETVWWYKFPQQGLFYAFLFNKQGRVIQIQAHGYKPDAKVPTAKTAQGITLGMPLGAVLKNYGWSNDGEHTGDYVVLRYGRRERIAFQSLRNQIVGITLGLVK